jgi:hypothetical protein
MSLMANGTIRCDGCGMFSRHPLGEYTKPDGSAGYINCPRWKPDDGNDYCDECQEKGLATMSKMSNLHINTAPGRADEAARDLAYLRSVMRRLADDAADVAEGFIARGDRTPEVRGTLLGRLARIAAELKEHGQE